MQKNNREEKRNKKIRQRKGVLEIDRKTEGGN